ncbi:D-glycero-D-manno-heptose 1,7-bisphosphate phosphatase [Desulfurella amilsii]|uniref:D,D-heptose 1,7-bisphosphate phosphatase n=1 Tax=Desulfurella amilsii TaxID=1562698 RepID=A0A1X4XX95_9BACT|nr:HAD family hydrolase [Desulfurella amilsii]OSS42170.1 D-glycero-D-manno-heptose 1,7-bisphosphate phosphatase [Desulfurella amilsii]
MENLAVFLDRDGTIIRDPGYLKRFEDIKCLPNIKKSLKIFKQLGYKIIVITNQSGIARGYFSEDFVKKTHETINKRCLNLIDAFYFCPHLPEDNCACRKPKTALIDQAIADFNIKKEGSFVIGDKESDVELGLNAGIEPILILNGEGIKCKSNTKASYIFRNLYEVALWIYQKASMA